MENFIVIGILALIVGAVIFYLVGEKKKGVKCIGCPYAKGCASKGCSKCGGGCTNRTENQKIKNT